MPASSLLVWNEPSTSIASHALYVSLIYWLIDWLDLTCQSKTWVRRPRSGQDLFWQHGVPKHARESKHTSMFALCLYRKAAAGNPNCNHLQEVIATEPLRLFGTMSSWSAWKVGRSFRILPVLYTTNDNVQHLCRQIRWQRLQWYLAEMACNALGKLLLTFLWGLKWRCTKFTSTFIAQIVELFFLNRMVPLLKFGKVALFSQIVRKEGLKKASLHSAEVLWHSTLWDAIQWKK